MSERLLINRKSRSSPWLSELQRGIPDNVSLSGYNGLMEWIEHRRWGGAALVMALGLLMALFACAGATAKQDEAPDDSLAYYLQRLGMEGESLMRPDIVRHFGKPLEDIGNLVRYDGLEFFFDSAEALSGIAVSSPAFAVLDGEIRAGDNIATFRSTYGIATDQNSVTIFNGAYGPSNHSGVTISCEADEYGNITEISIEKTLFK